MNRNQSAKKKNSSKSLSKQSSIPSISSHVPLMTTNKKDETYLLTPTTMNTNTKADGRNPLQSFPMNSPREAKRSRTICQPKGTIPYTVADADTLEKVALRFNSTPSELLQLNKLNTRMIFPGQILFVPEDRPSDDSDPKQSTTSSPPHSKSKDDDAFNLLTDRPLSSEISSVSLPPSRQHSQSDIGPVVWSINRKTAARPGRAERLKSCPSTESEPSSRTVEERLLAQIEENSNQVQTLKKTLSEDENQKLDEECLQRFIKVNVRLMTEDHQSIAGTLLVTPNAVMFDPDILDPLIKEHGIDKYGLIIKMDLLAGISLYEDLAMYEHEATVRDEEKRKMYRSISVKSSHHNQPNTSLNTDEEQIHDLMMTLLDKIDKELNPSTSTDTCMIFNASSALQHHVSKNSSDNNHFDDDTFLPIPTNDHFVDDSFQSLDDYKHSIGILLDNNDDDNQNRYKNFNRVPSQGCHLENCVPPDQINQRFDEIDKLLQKQQHNYLTPHPLEIPYYLCFKTSINVHDIPSLHPKQYKKPSEKNIGNAYGEKPLEYEYWFAVPKEKVDHLYSFFLLWTPERQLDPLLDVDNDASPIIDPSKLHDKSVNKGFVLLATDDPELSDDYLIKKKSKNQRRKNDKQQQGHYLKQKDKLLKEWEIISVDEIYRRLNSSNNSHNSNDGIPPPTLLQPSTLINEEQTKQILLELPARIHAMNWYMTFSTESHGFSLNQLFRRSVHFDHDSPSLLIIKDVEQNIFGAFIPHQLTISEGFYGTGESFLFTLSPEFRVFNWSGLNEFFVKGDLNSLGFGSGEGTYGLWIDGDLNHGRTCPSKTYNNELLTTNEDFIIASIEVWTFID